MTVPRSVRFRRLIVWGSLVVMALFAGVRLAGSEPRPWVQVGAVAVGTAVLFGPSAWVVRDRIPEERRERLTYVAAGAVLLCAPIVLGLGLISGGLLTFFDAVVLGSVIGLAVVSLLERAVVPERLRGTSQ